MLTEEAAGCCVAAQFHSMELCLCRGRSPRGRCEGVRAVQLPWVSGGITGHCSTEFKNQ